MNFSSLPGCVSWSLLIASVVAVSNQRDSACSVSESRWQSEGVPRSSQGELEGHRCSHHGRLPGVLPDPEPLPGEGVQNTFRNGTIGGGDDPRFATCTFPNRPIRALGFGIKGTPRSAVHREHHVPRSQGGRAGMQSL